MVESLDEMLGQFDANSGARATRGEFVSRGQAITVWVPSDKKSRYDDLQARSGRRFSKTIRALVIAAITKAGAKT